MRFRFHRELLEDSMQTCVVLENKTDLERYLQEKGFRPPFEVKYYTYDPRMDWKTFLVTSEGHAIGFTDSD